MSLLPNDLTPGSTAVIPMLTEAGPTQPFFAPASGGGGGGGGGPNPVVSTLTVNPTGQILSQAGASTIGLTSYAGEMNDGKFYPGWLTTDGGANTTSMFTGQVGFQGPGESQSGEVYASIRGGNNNDFGVTTLIADCRGFQIQNAGGPTFLNVSSINVSSINGAQPGGGVPTNLEVSTLRVSQGAPNTGIVMKYSDGTSSFGVLANDGSVFNQIKPSLVYGNNFGNVVSLGADIVAGGLGLTGTGGSLTSQTAGYISGDGAGNIGISSLNVSSINSASPGSLAVGGIAKFSTIQVSSIGLQGFSVPLFQNGRLTMPNAPSTVIETDIVFSDTTWGAWAGYDGAVNAAVSSIGTEVLSRSTFALFAQGGLGVSWQVLGN